MNAIKEKAYAKINLYLDVLGIRADGFHEIKSVMHSVSLADDVLVSVLPAKELSIKLSIEGSRYLPNDSKNLVYKAAQMFAERLGVYGEIRIKLVKRIPVAAGLAGGSSDAAATLRALNKLYKRPFTIKALAKMGAELGSDVPYCVVGKTALCEGRGECISHIKTSSYINAVIVSTNEYVSTPDAYKSLDKLYADFDGSVRSGGDVYYEKLMREFEGGKIPFEGMFNIFESAVLPNCEKAAVVKELLVSLGALNAMMSGSGPSVFGVFENKKAAQNAEQKIKDQGYRAWSVVTV